MIGRCIEQVPALRWSGGVGDLNVVARLDHAQIVPELVVLQKQPVADPELRAVLSSHKCVPIAHLDNGKIRRPFGLAVEEINDGGHCIELKLLIGVELKLHWLLPTVV